MRAIFVIVIVVVVVPLVTCFNVEANRGVDKFLLKQPNQQSYFGYNFHMSDYKDEDFDELLFPVSAPMDMIMERTTTADSTSTSNDRPPGAYVQAMGNLFACSVPRSDYLNESRSTFNCRYRPHIDRKLLSDDVTTREGLTMAMAVRSTGKTGPDIFERQQIAVCAPAHIHACGLGTGKTEGICYMSERKKSRGDSGFTTTWNRINPCYEQCSGKPIDMMFVLDGSGSVHKENFEKVKSWVEQVAGSFNIANDTQVGVVQYSYWEKSRTQYLKTEIELGFFPNKTQFAEAVSNIKYQGFKTFTAHALNKTIKEDFMGASGRYPDANRVLILLTDGRADDKEELDSAIAFAESERVTRFAVGVANYDLKELRKIASSPDYVFTVSRFDLLKDIIAKLQNSIETLEGHGNVNSTNELSQCESGFSADFDDNGRLLLGAVGAYDWSGTVAKYDAADDKEADIPNYAEVQGVLPNRTKESYLGYSVTTGRYNGGSADYVASGAPRYYMRGAVVVYKPRKNSKKFDDAVTIHPHADHNQFGSYFGGSLLSMDLNNDDKDDLLVAAPLYIGTESDEGRVFVYITGSGSQNVQQWADASYKPVELKGRGENGARFGTAMASAGDLNKDGYNDVIIGAPLTENGRGAVYVYHGSAEGIVSTPRQRIGASDVQGTKLEYFGQSLQGGVDLDGNHYPDVAVGAPKSDTIAIFRSRPVAVFDATVTFSESKIDIFSCLEKTNRQCQDLEVCITISGDEVEDTATVDLKIRLDPTFGRLQFRTRSESSNGQLEQSILNVTLVKDTKSCRNFSLYLKSKIDNYNDAATAVFEYGLTKEHVSRPLSSISDPSKDHFQVASMNFEKKCEGASVCQYDLDLQSTLVLPPSRLEAGNVDLTNGGKRLVVAAETQGTVMLKVNLTNTQQSAFDAQVIITYSPQLSWNEITDVTSSNPKYQDCMQDKGQPVIVGTTVNTKVIHYEYDERRGNIMPKNHWCTFIIKLTWDKLKDDGSLPQVVVNLNAATLNNQNDSIDIDPSNNVVKEYIPVVYKSSVDGKRLRSESTVALNVTETNSTINNVNQIGRQEVQVKYEIYGRGYSNIPTSHISLTYPAKFADGLYLLYLYDYTCLTRASVDQKTKCTCDTSVVNILGLGTMKTGANDTVNNATYAPNPNPFTLSEIDCSNKTTADKMCATLRCKVDNLAESQRVTVEAKFHVWIPTFSFVMNKTEKTVMKVNFDFNTENSSLVLNKNGEKVITYTGQHEIIAELYRPPTEIQQSNQIWIYIVAGIAGLLLLLLAVFILYKCGFFKSKYAQKKEELEWEDADGGGAEAT